MSKSTRAQIKAYVAGYNDRRRLASRSLNFVVHGRPQQVGSKVPIVTKNGKAVAIDSNKKSKPWMAQVRSAAADAFTEAGHTELITEPVTLSVAFAFRRPKSHFGTGRNANIVKRGAPPIHAQSPDLAKLVRCLEDALTGVVWADDKLVYCYREVRREWTTGGERATVTIEW